MNLIFRLRFSTRYGQQLLLMGDHPSVGNNDPAAAIPMRYLDDQWWGLELDIKPGKTKKPIRYKYLLRESDGRTLEEWGMDRQLDLSGTHRQIQTADTWNHAGEYEQAFLTGPFLHVLLKGREVGSMPMATGPGSVIIFRVKAPLLKPNETLRLIGEGADLGNWQESHSLPLNWNGKEWEGAVQAKALPSALRYKYGIWDEVTDRWIEYEQGPDRVLSVAFGDEQTTLIAHDGFVRLPNDTWRGAGLSVPVFSIRSGSGFGVGEFADLPLLADWGKKLGLHLIQILPVNDTTSFHDWRDSYPYAGISAFALHPIYTSLKEIAGEEQADLIQEWEPLRKQLNDLDTVDYEAVMKAKWAMLRALYERMGKTCLQSPEYKAYWKEQQHWLKPYCVFSYLRDTYGTAEFSEWPDHHTYHEPAIRPLFKSGTRSSKEIAFFGFVQFHLHRQLRMAVDYLHEKGIILKGDIPIGVNRHGCEAWVSPELFHMSWQAGAPPDDFTSIGQNWGFPTYHWERMQADGYDWWKKRFRQMELYYDAFRIDHILGFFRIWSIPTHAVQGLLGRFVPAIPIRPSEFTDKGIPFDFDRFCRPYINDTYLHQLFGPDAERVRDHFLDPTDMGTYTLKPAYATQRQIERYFQQNDQWPSGTREKLYELVANVILFAEEGPEPAYHFRISIDKSYSFTCLPEHIRKGLNELYVDYFFRRQDDLWFREAMHKLPSLKSATNMLVCGEDLGMVPHCVPEVMKQLGILSLEVQRMPKDHNKRFFHPQEAPYLSVITPSTHDMSTLRAWWEEDPNRTRDFYHQELKHWGDSPQFCEPWINRSILTQHLNSPAMWSIFQVQDILGCSDRLRRIIPQEERINDPANPNHYWQYRMHVSLEQLLNETEFNEEFRKDVQSSGRV